MATNCEDYALTRFIPVFISREQNTKEEETEENSTL